MLVELVELVVLLKVSSDCPMVCPFILFGSVDRNFLNQAGADNLTSTRTY